MNRSTNRAPPHTHTNHHSQPRSGAHRIISAARDLYKVCGSFPNPEPHICQTHQILPTSSKLLLLTSMRRAVFNFLDSGSRFAILYECGISKTPLRNLPILVLDSSFNPPHHGHYSLVTNAATGQDSHVMLLLAISNADKGVCDGTALTHRVEMMSLMAKHLANSHSLLHVLVAITKHAMFVDKAREINRIFKNEPNFLLGFDTFIRILNPKYYEPRPLSEALLPLFNVAKLFVLTREEPELSAQQQLGILEKIKRGELEGVPAKWAARITMKEAFGPTTALSSSQIRTHIQEGRKSWHDHLLPLIRSYIESEQLY